MAGRQGVAAGETRKAEPFFLLDTETGKTEVPSVGGGAAWTAYDSLGALAKIPSPPCPPPTPTSPPCSRTSVRASPQLNLKLSRLVEGDAAPSAQPGENLDPLLDLLDALDEALARRPRGGFLRRRRDGDLWRGLALAAECAHERLRDQGIVPLPAEGTFDDRVHRAIERVPGPPERAGSLAETHRRGWVQGQRVLRSAQVSVWAVANSKDRER